MTDTKNLKQTSTDANTANPQLAIDLGVDTGPIKHGASGFLYGLGNDGIPSVNILAPLKPQVAAQKPEGGLQHPNGDAFNVAETYKAAGGREIQIYMQDIYPNWPYDSLGMTDYLEKVDSIVRQVMAGPNHSMFSYVPFNEPDNIWYNKTDKKQALFNDWLTVYQKIKSLDPVARTVGPNCFQYDSTLFRDFLTFAKNNNCLPDVISWHELGDEFFADWYNHYDDYRSIESSLDIPAREICINEYGRKEGDLGIPGKLVQWMARFENSKVDACLAYWTSAGCLNDLMTRDNYNQATGGWWLYKWYGSMTGHTVKVTPPKVNAEGLQGIAAYDSEKQQVRILFGGSGGSTDIVVTSCDSTPYFGNKVHVSIWATAFSGHDPSNSPTLVRQGNYAINRGQITVTVDDMVETTAYQMIISPGGDAVVSDTPANRYEAEYADLAGSARVIYGGNNGSPGTSFVGGYAKTNHAGTNFVVTANDNGFYIIKLKYSAGPDSSVPPGRIIRVMLNDELLREVAVPATANWRTWADANISAFLTAGINRISFNTLATEGSGATEESSAIYIDSIEVIPVNGTIDAYEAEAADNALEGTAAVLPDPAASSSKYVGHIGNGAANTLQFNNIKVPSDGIYRMVVHFANADNRGAHEYNSQIIDRYADICVNGGEAKRVYFRNTFAWNAYRTTVVDVELKAGSNTIKFSNNSTAAPHIDKIEIAAR